MPRCCATALLVLRAASATGYQRSLYTGAGQPWRWTDACVSPTLSGVGGGARWRLRAHRVSNGTPFPPGSINILFNVLGGGRLNAASTVAVLLNSGGTMALLCGGGIWRGAIFAAFSSCRLIWPAPLLPFLPASYGCWRRGGAVAALLRFRRSARRRAGMPATARGRAAAARRGTSRLSVAYCVKSS